MVPLPSIDDPHEASAIEARDSPGTKCTVRGRPYGSRSWVQQTAEKIGLRYTLRSRGRPPKHT